MALATRATARATAPHIPSLAATLAPLLAVANAGSFGLRYQDGKVIIEQGSFAGCNLAAIDAAIAAAPQQSDQLDAQFAVDALPILLKAIVLVVKDEVNILRRIANPVQPDRTDVQVIAAVRAKAGTL